MCKAMENENVKKMMEEWAQMRKLSLEEFLEKYGDDPVSISYENGKVGKTLSESTAPILGCGKRCSVCMGDCYAIKALLYPDARNAWLRNLYLFIHKPEMIEEKVNRVLGEKYARKGSYTTTRNGKKVKKTYAPGELKHKGNRGDVAGDMFHKNVYTVFNNVAKKNPDVKNWTYTKEYEKLNSWVKEDPKADNLNILFSDGWDGLNMDNPNNFPTTNIYRTPEEWLENKNGWELCKAYNVRQGKSGLQFYRTDWTCDCCVEEHCGCPYAKEGTTIGFALH